MNRKHAWTRGLAAAVLLLGSALAAAGDYLDPEQAFRVDVQRAADAVIDLRFEVAPGYHLYRERITVAAERGAVRLGAVVIPAGLPAFDKALQMTVEQLSGTVAVRVPVDSAPQDFRLRVQYQGCADEGLCYPPQTGFVDAGTRDGRIVQVAWRADDSSAPAPAAAAATVSESTRIEHALKSGDLLAIAGIFLVAGVLLSFTPCVLPMVPILSSIIVGQGAPVSRGRGFALAAAYALGMALVYTGFGVMAGLLGEGLAAALQNPWVLGGFALLLAALSLPMFGVFQLQMPGAIQGRLSEWSGRLPGGRLGGVFAMGGLSALIVGPCVAAPLAGALVFISRTRDVLIGGLALFSLALGMSVPLLLVGLSAGSLLPRAGAWMEGVKAFFGVLLLAVALWLVSPLLPAWALMGTIGAALLVAAACLGLFERLPERAGGRLRLSRGAALLLAVLGTTQLVGALSGGDDALQPLRHLARTGGDTASAKVGLAFRRVRTLAELETALQASGRPVLLDFYAQWCVSCKEMEHLTFADAAVRERLANALLLQVDVTDNNADDKALLRRFGLFGPPGIVFFDAQGRERDGTRVVGFQPAARFVESLAAAGM